jgi:uracil-DNA glycosylase family 4
MCDSARVLSFAAGNLNANVLFIGEAPGRLGADQTEIPFHGDIAGRNFEDLLAVAGLRRDSVFVTNAALCNPRDGKGNNAAPNSVELENCSRFLRRQIELVDPRIVVTLGAAALRATALLEPHQLALAEQVRSAIPWFGRTLVPLYHPGQRAMIHRSLANQRSDYQFVGELSRRGQRPRQVGGTTRGDIVQACKYLLSQRGELSYFELHKFIYLAEYLHVRRTGERLTSAFFIRQKDGPYCTDIHIKRLKRADSEIAATTRGAKIYLSLRTGAQRNLLAEHDISLGDAAKTTLDDVIARYNFSSEADLKKAVYLTAPMRLMLRREQREKINLYNAPIDFMAAAAG